MEGSDGRDTPPAASRERSRNVDAARSAFALKLAALHDLSLELSLAESLDELDKRAVVRGREVLGFDRIGIWLADSEDPTLLYGSFGTDEAGAPRDERACTYRRSENDLPPGFYEGREPVHYLGSGPCFNHLHEAVGSGERALALVWDGRAVIGEIWVDNMLSQRSIDGGSLELLVRFARMLGYLTSLKRAQAELKLLSEPDALTGAVNESAALLVLEKQLSLTARKKERLSIVYCALDGIKSVREDHGRASGEEYARAAAGAIGAAVRDCDTVGRLGSDAFVVVLPDCGADGAALTDERIGEALEALNGPGSPRPFRIAATRGRAHSGELGDIGPAWSAQALIDLARTRAVAARS